MDDEQEFLDAMQSLDPRVDDFVGALVYAMESVSRVPRDKNNRAEARYFGPIGDSTFYADWEVENTRWYPDTTPVEAIGLLEAEFGEGWTDGLEAFHPETD